MCTRKSNLGNSGRLHFCITFQKSTLLLNVLSLFFPSLKINLAHFSFISFTSFPSHFSLQMTFGKRKKVLQIEKFYKIFTCCVRFQEHNHDLFEKALLECVTSIKDCRTASKISDNVCYSIDHISLLYLSKILRLFNFVWFPFRCGLFSPFLHTVVRKSELLGRK